MAVLFDSIGGAGFLEASSSDDESSSDDGHGCSGSGIAESDATVSVGVASRVKGGNSASTSTDVMMQQNSAATQSRMRDLGYREGKLELVDANEFAQVCFERGVRKGAQHSAPAGRMRGIIAVLSAFRKETARNSDPNLAEMLDKVMRGFDALADPTTVPPDLLSECHKLCLQAGLPEEIYREKVCVSSSR